MSHVTGSTRTAVDLVRVREQAQRVHAQCNCQIDQKKCRGKLVSRSRQLSAVPHGDTVPHSGIFHAPPWRDNSNDNGHVTEESHEGHLNLTQDTSRRPVPRPLLCSQELTFPRKRPMDLADTTGQGRDNRMRGYDEGVTLSVF